jgi:hypothetical protein
MSNIDKMRVFLSKKGQGYTFTSLKLSNDMNMDYQDCRLIIDKLKNGKEIKVVGRGEKLPN